MTNSNLISSRMSPIQKLDEVLRFLYKDRGHTRLSSMFTDPRIKDFGFAADELNRILNKLIKDEFVEFNEVDLDRTYWISFEEKFSLNLAVTTRNS